MTSVETLVPSVTGVDEPDQSGLTWVTDRVEHGREDVTLLLDGVHAGSAQLGVWPEFLMICDVQPDATAPADLEIRLVQTLLERYDGLPKRVIHTTIHDPAVLRWYQRSPLARGCVLCGTHNLQTLFYDALDLLDPAALADAEDAPEWAQTWATVMFGQDLADATEQLKGDASELGSLWNQNDGTWRTVALRRIASDPECSELAEQLHYLALADHNSGVRQFASMQMSGHFELVFEPDVPQMVRAFADPLALAAPFGGLPAGTHPEHARRNARFALLFTLGNIGWAARSTSPQHWTQQGLAHLEHTLEQQCAELTPARDQWLYDIAIRELNGECWTGIGLDAPLSLLEMCRYTVHRYRLIRRMGLGEQDRFYWIVVSVESLCPSPLNPSRMEGPDDRPIPTVVYGPSPTGSEPDPDDFPARLRGQNHFAEYWAQVAE